MKLQLVEAGLGLYELARACLMNLMHSYADLDDLRLVWAGLGWSRLVDAGLSWFSLASSG